MRVVNGNARTITIVFFGEVFWLLLIGIVHIHSAPTRVSLALAASVVLAFAIRSGFSHVLILEPGRLTTRTLTRTRSWNYDELRSAERVSGTKTKCGRSFIVLQPKIGKSYSFKALSEEPDSTSLTERAVRETNARILYSSTIS